MKALTLYTSPQSRGSSVRWMLEECGADYQTVSMPLASLKAPEYLRINPLGKVPALKAGDTVLTETLGIVTWLAERFPQKKLIPDAGSIARGEYYRWMCFALHLEYASMDRMRQLDNRADLRTAIGYGSFDEAFALLKARVQKHPCLVGDRFSTLDLYYTGLLAWLIHGAQVLPADPVFIDYMAPHMARPAFAKAQALDAADAGQPAN